MSACAAGTKPVAAGQTLLMSDMFVCAAGTEACAGHSSVWEVGPPDGSRPSDCLPCPLWVATERH